MSIEKIKMENVQVMEGFWLHFMEQARRKLIPYQWEALNDRIEGNTPSYCLRNFRIASGKEQGEFGGRAAQDSDICKWIEAASYSLIHHPDEQLEKTLDEVTDLILSAQQPDGYLNTYYILTGLEKRWTDLQNSHELYAAGHMIEAAVAHYRATGKDKFLNGVRRYVDLLAEHFGAEEGKCHGYPGHEEIELALVKLYDVTGVVKYLQLAEYFINQRGQAPLYFEEERFPGKMNIWSNTHMGYQYYQAGKPVREQKEAEGHAVRAMYLYSAMADLARKTGDESLYQAVKNLWNNVTKRRMYITGGIGSSKFGEVFTYDYDLPNDTVYAETCASIGLVFFASRMLRLENKREYADVMERALYNGIISGMDMDGTRFFYVNPLEVVPEASEKDEGKCHIKPQRQRWFGCPCCPPNLARLLSSLPDYTYRRQENTVYVDLFMNSRVQLEDGLRFSIETQYPWNGQIKLTVESGGAWTFALRIPGWCRQYDINQSGQEQDGYVYIQKEWKQGEEILLDLMMKPELIRANPRVRENVGKMALMRGPVVYCLEEADNGRELHRIRLDKHTQYHVQEEKDLLGGIVTISAAGKRLVEETETLYYTEESGQYQEAQLRWIPYYAWANRQKGEMMVWIRS